MRTHCAAFCLLCLLNVINGSVTVDVDVSYDELNSVEGDTDGNSVELNSFPVFQSEMMFPKEILPYWNKLACFDQSKLRSLIRSSDMLDRLSTVYVRVPYLTFVNYFFQPKLLPTYNADVKQVNFDKFETCKKFDGRFNTIINAAIPEGFAFSPPTIVHVHQGTTESSVGWMFEVSNPSIGKILYTGAHFFHIAKIYNNGLEAVKFTSWQKAFGAFVKENSAEFELGMGQTVLMPDILSASCLEKTYLTTRGLNTSDVIANCKH